jgi:mono/diheme cytochrome c family protein
LGVGPTAAPEVRLSVPLGPADLASGQALYDDRCAPCHGDGGLGDGPQAADLPNPPAALGDSGVGLSAVPADWYSVVTRGRIDRLMPPFESLTPEQRWDVVSYALTLSEAPSWKADGAELFQDLCADCHGSEGEGTQDVAALAETATRSERSLEEIAEVIRTGLGEDMPGFGDQLGESDLLALAAYSRSLAILAGAAEPPPAAASATLRGTVLQGTPDQGLPLGIEVTLHGFDGENQVVTQTARTDEQGGFVFPGVESVPGRLFAATVEYRGVIYGSDAVHLLAGEPPPELTITLFETTTDLSAVGIARLHVLFEFPSEGVVEVVELWLVSNSGDRTISTPEGEGVLAIPLPDGASPPIFEEGPLGGRFQEVPGGFLDTLPLRPGSDAGQVTFSYSLPYERELEFVRDIPYRTEAVVILTPGGGPRIAGEGLIDRGEREVGGTLLHQYELGSLDPGGRFSLKVSGSPGSAPGIGAGSGLAVALAGLGLALAVAGAAWWWLRRGTPAAPATIGPSREPDAVIVEIARLDDEFEAGRLSEELYRARRAELVQRAVETLRGNRD